MKPNEKVPYKSFGRLFYEAFLIAVTILLLLTALTCLLVLPTSHHPASKTDAARRTISTLSFALNMYEVDFGRPASWADEKADYELNNAKLIQALTSGNGRSGPYLDVRAKEMRDGMHIDPWGRPYHVAVDANGDRKIELGRLAAHGTFAVWSEGPNQHNDHGKEDDIIKTW